MPDIPAASAVSAVSATAAAASNNIVVETAVNSVPDKIAMLSRQIEVSGTLVEPPQGATVTINTLIGPLTLMLPQLAQMQQDKLIQQLMVLFQNQRPLTVVLQPGNPPSQALLLLPPVTTPAQSATSAFGATPTPGTSIPLPPITANIVLSAIVLPNSNDSPSASPGQITPPQPAQAGTPGYPGFNPQPALNPVTMPSLPASALQTLIKNTILSGLEQQLPPNAAAGEPDAPNAALAPFPLQPPVAQGLPATALPQTPSLSPLTAPSSSPPNAEVNPFVPPPADLENISFSLTPPSVNANAPASLGSLLQPGTELTLRVTTVLNPQSPAPVLQPNQVIATVTGSGPGGQIILKTDAGATLFVRQPISAPNGTQLVLTVEPAVNEAQNLVTLPEALEYSSLPQIFAALAQIDPAALRQIIATRMPVAGETLPSTLLLFLSAVRDGDVRSWLGGNATDLLTRAGKAELITRLTQELQQTGQETHDDVVGQWRSYAVPLFDNNNLAAFYIHIHGHARRHGGGSDKNQPADSKTQPGQVRFVIDVRMSKLGVMQLDGFLRPRKLDIIMRSENRLPSWLDNELRQTYKKTLDAIGYSGGIAFQAGRGSWVHIQKPAAGAAMVT